MSRSYWEHLCWELEKRRTSVAEEKRQLLSILSSSKTCELHEIHPDDKCDRLWENRPIGADIGIEQ